MRALVTGVARLLCKQSGCDPDYLEPGDVYGVDGVNKNGDPCHFKWRENLRDAKEIVKFCQSEVWKK